jgi:hypothetical protein
MESEISPSEKLDTSIFPNGSPSARAICVATGRLELHVKILMSLP